MYRCTNEACSEDPHGRLIYDFESDRGVCPKCGADRQGGRVVRREVIHFDPSRVAGGRNAWACAPGQPLRPLASGDPRAVTCAACRGTEAYAAALAALGDAVEGDFPVEVDARAGMIRRG